MRYIPGIAFADSQTDTVSTIITHFCRAFKKKKNLCLPLSFPLTCHSVGHRGGVSKQISITASEVLAWPDLMTEFLWAILKND
jgi:hypothetical protein